jgi:hypothetical protein
LFETAGARAVGISFRWPHHSIFHYKSIALLASIMKAVLGRDSNCGKNGRPSGCAVMNFKVKLPSME